jgi:hypothetical protein
MFQTTSPDPINISVIGCGFDSNGWNGKDFLSVLSFKAGDRKKDEVSDHKVSKISIRNNRFFDSDPPGRADCDLGQDECATLQRQYVVALDVERDRARKSKYGLVVEDNTLSDGGRIKARGADMVIRRNHLDFINDNGITIVDRGAGVTKNVRITDNVVKDAVAVGIFFGSDGQNFAARDGMELRNISVLRNDISGAFTTAGIKTHLPPQAHTIRISGNKIQSAPPRPHPPNERPSAILVLRDDSVTDPSTASGIAVEDNQVSVGPHGGYHNGAIQLEGSMHSPKINSNVVVCKVPLPASCDEKIDDGIWLKKGTIPAPEISYNRIDGARNSALHIGWHRAPIQMPERALIYENYFSGIRSKPGKGRIWLQAIQNARIKASISRNEINNVAGWGIYCSAEQADPDDMDDRARPPADRFALLLHTNRYANPDRGVHPLCPPTVSGPVLARQ